MSDSTGALPRALAGPVFQVNTYTDSIQSKPATARLADGGFVVAWASFMQDGSENGVYGRRYGADGAPRGGEFRINRKTDGYQEAPAVAGLADGGFVVVFESDYRDSFEPDIHGQRFTASGKKVGSEFTVSAGKGSFRPRVAALSDGGFVVVWMRPPGVTINYKIFARRYAASGEPVGEEFMVDPPNEWQQFDPAVAALRGDRGFVVVWTSLDRRIEYNVYGQVFLADGNRVGGRFRVNRVPFQNFVSPPRIATLTGGGLVVVWVGPVPEEAAFHVYGQRLSARGEKEGRQFRVDLFSRSSVSVEVTSLVRNRFVVLWKGYAAGTPHGAIYGQRYASDGRRDRGEFLFARPNRTDAAVAAARTANGFVATWDDDEIMGRRFAR